MPLIEEGNFCCYLSLLLLRTLFLLRRNTKKLKSNLENLEFYFAYLLMSVLQFPPINYSHILPTSFCYWWKSSSFSCNCIFSPWNISLLWNINLSWLPCHTAFCGFLPTLLVTLSHFAWLFILYPLINAGDYYSSIWSYPLISCVTSFLDVPMHFLDFSY